MSKNEANRREGEQPVEEREEGSASVVNLSEPDLAAELEEAREQLKVSEEKVLRLAADFDNSRKRLERDKDILLKYAEENILKELLLSIDNLERALEQGTRAESDAFFEGVKLTHKGLLDTLDRFGVKPIVSLGEPFDPNIHEALAMEESSEAPANTVLKEFQRGYNYKDRLLRAAKVIVVKGGSEEAAE